MTEPRRSRDHTERLLNHVGVSVVSGAVSTGWRVELRDPPERIRPLDFAVPGDVSSAAFILAFATLGGGGGRVTVESVGLNPTRTAFLDVLERMGAKPAVAVASGPSPEPMGSVTVEPSELEGVAVYEDEVPRLVDELPLIAVLGACARGTTRITGASELRAKESDRISAVVSNLEILGVAVEELPDGLVVRGSAAPLRGRVRACGDHRIAMAFGVLSARGGNRVEVDQPELADVSFPGFWSLLERIGHRDAGGRT